jgi:PKD repeat protein
MLGGVPFNYATVIWAMNAVYQSNVNGTVRNTPFGGDEANTETLPAYILSTWLFENEMRNETGYWITGLENTNVTAIVYSGDTLLIQAVGDTGSSLAIANDTWNYTYTVRGFETIRLTITHLSVGISPVSVVMDVGQSQLFASNVSGGVSPYTYQWYLNNSTVPDANSSTWAYMPTETGSYVVFVKVNDSVGTQAMSNTVTVKVNAAPSVTASLSSATLDVGQSVTLNSTVSGGTSPYSYQWYLNGLAVKGATSATWTHIFNSSGSYTVYLRVTDAVSYSAVSNASAVTVNILPSVTVSPHSAALDTNQSVTFTSSISGGTSPYSYQWYLNGAPVTGATGASWAYTFTSSGSCTVYLEVTDAVSETAISNAAVVTVNVPPSIIVSPGLATLDVSQSVTFTSTVFGGTSPYSYKWYLNGVLQTGTTGTWTFTPTSSGSYSVNVTLTDAVGTIATSNVATITVNARPSVTVSLGSVALDAGASQTFTSTVSGGTSPYSYQWYLNGSAVAGASGSSWTCTFNSPGFYTVNVVVIDAVGVSATSSPMAITVKTPVSVTTIIEIIIAIIEAVVVATFLVMLRKRKRQ